jgi:hypothetical protein
MGTCWNPEPRDDPDLDPERKLEIIEQKYLAHLDRTTAHKKDDRIRYHSTG